MIDPRRPDYSHTPTASGRPHFHYLPVEKDAKPWLSIVTPFYNTGPVFHETAQSVLQQSFQQFEWIIVNDKSTDPAARAVLESYRTRDPRIRVLDHDTNRGQGAARNTGYRAARAAYVVQLDSDDLLEPSAIEKWLWFLESHPEYAFAGSYSVAFGGQEYLWQNGFHSGAVSLEDNQIDNKTMVRTAVHTAVAGYDETIREGVEDWDFWLRCANAGYWGGTVPEFLAWYRRRPAHSDRWTTWDDPEWWKQLRATFRQKYRKLWNGEFPQPQQQWHSPFAVIPEELPCHNQLSKTKPRVLLMVPWLSFGGAEKFNLDAIAQLTQRGWEVSIVATLTADHAWLPQFSQFTPDIFILPHFLRVVDYPRFLRYLINSRQIDVVIISQCDLGYFLLPYLRATCPTTAFVDLSHIEDESWRGGGYPRMGVEYQGLLDLNVVTSEHLQRWMEKHGAERQRIAVCYTNADTTLWCPATGDRRALLRRELQLPESTPVIIYVGRICAQKQPRVFANTIALLAQQHLDFQAIVAGDGPDLEWLRTFVKKQGLTPQVSFLGAVASDRIRELLQAADVFFLPSEWEGISLAIYEAMACGLPVVGGDVGGQRELLTPECGALVSRSDEQAEAQQYAEELARLLHGDPLRRQALGQAARKRIEDHFPLSSMGDRIVSLLQEAMHFHQSKPRTRPTFDVARISAMHAIEYTRLAEVTDGLWRERGLSRPATVPAHLLDPEHDSWRTLAYFTLRRAALPYYRALLAKNVKWLLPMKNKLKTTFLRNPRAQGEKV